MITEIYGLPGSGKTTWAKQQNYKIIKIKSWRELLWFNLIFLCIYPVKFFWTLAYIIKNSPNWKLLRYKIINCFLHHNAKYQKAKRYDNALIDQGHFQNIISVFEKELSEQQLLRYLKFIPYPDNLIIFDIDSDKRKKYLEARGYKARDNFDNDYRKNWEKVIEENDRLFKSIVNKIKVKYFLIKIL